MTGRISDDPAAVTLAGAEMAGIQGGANVRVPASLFQPIDADLTAIAALATATYGRSLLTLANSTALAAEVDAFFLTPTEGNAAYQPLDNDLTSWAAVTRAAGFDTFTATPSSANLRSLLSDETGTGSAVFATAPTITGPVITTTVVDLQVGQIKFPGTPNPSANANTLDDYTEVNWTPSPKFGGAAVGLTTTNAFGRLTKIGRLVYGFGRVTFSAKGSSTGTFTMTGLPYTSLGHAPGYVTASTNFTGLTGALSAFVDSGGTTVTLYQSSATGNALLTDTVFTNTTDVFFSFVYEAT